MRSHRDVAAQTNLDAARRLVRSLVGVMDVAFRTDAAGRIDGVAVLPAPGSHERQVRLNVASGMMAGFGVALDPMKIEIASAPEALRAIEAAAGAEPLARANGRTAPGHPVSQVDRQSLSDSGAARPSAPSAPEPAPRPTLRPRVPEGAAGLAARALQSVTGDAGRAAEPTAPTPAASVAEPWSRPSAGDAAADTHRPAAPPPAEAQRPVASPAPAVEEPAAPVRRVRLVEDDAFPPAPEPATRETPMPGVRPFPVPPAQPVEAPAFAAAAAPGANGTGHANVAPQHHHGGNGRAAAAYAPNGRNAAAAALALPVEPAPAPAPPAEAPAPAAAPRTVSGNAALPALELAEVVATSGATFCRVVVVVDGEPYTGVAELTGSDAATLETVARITADALRSARVPRAPIQFHGANTVDVGGKAYVIAVLRAWNGRAFDDLTAVEPVRASAEEAVALAVLRAAASRID